MNKERISVMTISDVHFGALSPETLYNELKVSFLNKIPKELPNMLVINGDLTDKMISFNDKHSVYLIKFMNDIIDYAKKFKFKVRLVKGTDSHDLSQLDNFISFNNEIDIRIINSVTEEEPFPDFKVLYVPEEPVVDMNEYYKEFLEKEGYYDLVLGHGTFDFVAFDNQKYESEKPLKNSPVLNSDDFNKILKETGRCIFGHIHVKQKHKKIFYGGSFSCWCFGEDKADKGYYIYRIEEGTTKMVFVKNKLAKKYITFDISKEIADMSTQEITEYIKEIKESNSDSQIRFKYDKTDNSAIIKTLFSKDKSVKISEVNRLVKEKNKEEQEEEKKFEYLFDNELTEEEKIQKTLLINTGKNLSLEKIKDLIKQ